MYSPLLRDDTFTADATCVGLTAFVVIILVFIVAPRMLGGPRLEDAAASNKKCVERQDEEAALDAESNVGCRQVGWIAVAMAAASLLFGLLIFVFGN